jgi:hypothetical protein
MFSKLIPYIEILRNDYRKIDHVLTSIEDVHLREELFRYFVVNINQQVLHLVKNPSERMQEYAIWEDPQSIRFVKNPTEDMIRKAWRLERNILKYVSHIPDALQVEIVKVKATDIRYINAPCEDAQIAAVKQDAYSLCEIDNPTDKVVIMAIKKVRSFLYEPVNEDKISPSVLYYFSQYKYFNRHRLSSIQLRKLRIQEVVELRKLRIQEVLNS